MRANRWPLVMIAALTLVGGVGLYWQQQTTVKLQEEVARRHRQYRERQILEAEHQRLAAAQPGVEQLDALLTERTAVAQLREGLALLQRRVKSAAAVQRNTPSNPPLTAPSIKDSVLAYPLWKNLGRTTPEASFETALWASAGGDIDALVPLLVFDPEARNEAATLFARLPANLRQEFVSPEQLVAVLVAKDIPLGSATILNQYPTPNETKMAVQIFDPEGKQKLALLSLRPDAAGWRFVVPVNAVKRYAAWLRPSSVTTYPPP